MSSDLPQPTYVHPWLALSEGAGATLASWKRRAYRQRVRQAFAADRKNARRRPGTGTLHRDPNLRGAWTKALVSVCARLHTRKQRGES